MFAALSRRPCHSPKTQTGVALLEALIAVLIFSFGILAVVGLQANAMRISTDAKMRIDASNTANQQVGQLWADSANLSAYNGREMSVSSLPEGKLSILVATEASECRKGAPPSCTQPDCVNIKITWKVPGDSTTQILCSTTRINPNP